MFQEKYNKVVARDIINNIKEITFNYRDCNVKVTINNDIANIGITKITKIGLIIEKHKTFALNNHYKYLAAMINIHLKFIDSVYNELLEEEIESDKKVVDF